jgi:hypothetical protein
MKMPNQDSSYFKMKNVKKGSDMSTIPMVSKQHSRVDSGFNFNEILKNE